MHSFKIHKIHDGTTIMVCKCGLTYYWNVYRWMQADFFNRVGSETDAPVGCCGTSDEEQQEEKE
jgi:hypothetical protein